MKLTPCLALFLVTTLLNHQWIQADEQQPAQQKSKTTAGNPAKQSTTDRRLQKSSKDQNNDRSAEDAAPTAGDAVQLQRGFIEDALKNLSVKPDLAGKIAAEATDPATETEAKTRIHQITGAAADLDIVSANQKVRDAVVDAISRSKNPKETADKEVGQAAIDTVFGREVTTLVPIDKLGRAIFSNLAAISGALQNMGANEDNPIVIETVKEGAKLGVTTPEAARVVFEKGAHKVLDEQGFIAAKPGESLGDRLAREVEAQKKLQAKLDSKKLSDAAKASAKARVAQQAAKANVGNMNTRTNKGASQSVAAGRMNKVPVSGIATVTGGDGGGLSAGLESRFGRNMAAEAAAKSAGNAGGDGSDLSNQVRETGGQQGTSGSGAGSGGNGGGGGGGSGSGDGEGAGSGDGTGRGGNGGGGGSGGEGGGGAGEEGSSGKGGDEKDGEGKGDAGGGTGDASASHEDDLVDLSGEGMTMNTEEDVKAQGSTPDPMDIGGGDPSQLAARTGGRIGTQEARRQQRGLDLARFGGAAGPNPNDKGGAPSLLTPEEKANADRALSMRLGAGVTNPNPLGKDSVVATERDLKDIHLRGNGGAKGPTDAQGPAQPQDPHSPIAGPTPGLAPTGGTRINGAKMRGANINGAIKIDGQVAKDAVKSLQAK